MVKHIAKRQQTDALYNSLVGSIICTIGIVTGRTEKECRKTFNTLKRSKQSLGNTVSEIFNFIWDILGKDESIPLRSNIVLIWDKYNIRSPLVTLVNEDGNILPLKPTGEYTGILMSATAGSDSIGVEYLFTETGEEIKDEEEGTING